MGLFRAKYEKRLLLIAGIFGALLLTADANAAIAPTPVEGFKWGLQLASGGCGTGMRRNLAGHCVRDTAAVGCPAGTRMKYITSQGVRRGRCVPT
jgi:hypothetical protein